MGDEYERERMKNAYEKYRKACEACEELMSSLRLQAEKKTWAIYEKWEKEGKIPADLLERYLHQKRLQEKDPSKFSLYATRGGEMLMFYYFDKSGLPPYSNLCLNRYKESGKPVETHLWGDDRYPPELFWPVKKDELYLQFKKEIDNRDLITLDRSRNENYLEVKKFAKEKKLHIFNESDLQEIVDTTLSTMRIIQRHEKEQEFLLHLLKDDMQKRLLEDSEAFFKQMELKYEFFKHMKLRHAFQYGIDHVRQLVCSFIELGGGITLERGKFVAVPNFQEKKAKQPKWLEEMKEKIVAHVEENKKIRLMKPIRFVDYIKMKFDLAKEIGLIVMDKEKGHHMDVHEHLFLKKFHLEDEIRTLQRRDKIPFGR